MRTQSSLPVILGIALLLDGTVWLTSPLWIAIPPPEIGLGVVEGNEPWRGKVRVAAEKRPIRLKQSCGQEPNGHRMCPIHREPLKPDAVEIRYGLVSFPAE